MASGASNVMKRNLKLFNGENYLMWKFRLSEIIEQEGASRVLEEDPPTPLTEEWIKWERFARGTLIEYLDDIILSQLPPGRATAKEILEKFDGLYACKKVSAQLCVQDRLFNCKLKPGTSIKKHMMEIEEMVRDLTACGMEVSETTKVWYMLNSLPSTYAPVKAAIKTMTDDRLTLAFVKGMLQEHEEYLIRENSDTSTKALHFRTTKTVNQKWKTKDKFSQRKSFKNKTIPKCFHCGRKNHIKRDCYFYKQSIKMQDKYKKNNNHDASASTAVVNKSFAFMIGNKSSNYVNDGPGSFVLDSGATEHIINDLELFTTYKQLVEPICITVAKKGTVIEATHIGTIKVNTTLGYSGELMDVLYSSNVPANLISVRRIQEAGMSVIFTETGNVEIKKGDTTMIKGSICGGNCCDSETELLLKEQGRKDFADLLRHNSRSLLGPINRTSSILQNHIWELAHQSENKTMLLFSQVYRSMAVLSRETIEILYRDIRDYVKIDPNDQKPTKTPDDISKSVERFFTNLFPLAYHQQTGLSSGDFTVKYKQCLKDNMDIIAPFGDIPKDIAQSLSKSLEATRLLLQAFSIGIEVLNTTDTLIIDEHSSTSLECHSALLKMTYCPKCLALPKNSKPCSGYCLNVLRGCLSKYVAELDLPWNSYVEGIESLINAMKRTSNDAGVNVDLVIRNLDGQISSAIMYCMEKIKDIDSRVKMTCKIPEFSQKLEALTVETSTVISNIAKSRQPSSRSFSHFPDAHITSFLSTISKTKGFYANLADNLCGDESFAEQRDKKCWNGERIAEYTKTVVDGGLDMQKYNPEVKASPDLQHVDPKIANLVDKLRHVHHMAVSSLGPNYAEADYMQRDGVDGSGSGNGPDFEESDDEYSRGSGSGNGPIESDDEKPISSRKNNQDHGEETSKIVPTVVVHQSSSDSCTASIITIALMLTIQLAISSRN